jgi:hypothetical protein
MVSDARLDSIYTSFALTETDSIPSLIQSAYTPYGERETWSDVTPLPQVEPADGLVAIMYSPECKPCQTRWTKA